MKLRSVKIVNILSIEQAYVEFSEDGLTLVQGWNHDVGRANGAGKTAIFNAITFALYDKLPRKITATEILRRGSKAGYVELCVGVGADTYVVRRSRPKGVAFLKGSETLTVTQEGWERILGLNYTQFILSMYCTQGASNRFLSIGDTEKKQFLLQLLNLEEFSSCKLLADAKVQALEAEQIALKAKLTNIESKVGAYSESLVDEEAMTVAIASDNADIKQYTGEIMQLQLVPKPDTSKYQRLEEDVQAKKSEITRAKTKREMFHDQYRNLLAKEEPFNERDVCDHCGSSIDASAAKAVYRQEAEARQLAMGNLKLSIDELDAIIAKEGQLNELYVRLRDRKKTETKEYDTALSKLNQLQTLISLKQQQVKQLTLKLQNNSELLSKIKQLEASKQDIVNNTALILRGIELYKTVSSMYSPMGAQAYILDSVIESFNEKVAEYVGILWSNMSYELKSYKENVKGDVTAKFSETLIMDGKPISIGSLSGGEFRALSLCVDFALVHVMERQFGISLSPIILDEPFDGLDGSGRELIVELLEQLSVNRGIVIVDHSSEVKSMFSKVINVEKRDGISHISQS